MLVIVVGSVFLKGLSALNLDFFFKTPAVYGATGGGIANAIVGTVVLVLLATVMAVPVGILVAIYLSEFAKPVDRDTAAGDARRLHRHPVDHHRRLRVRADRRRERTERLGRAPSRSR